jgi:hypothetical protein
MLEVLVQSGMKSAVPEPVTLVAVGASPEDAVDAMKVVGAEAEEAVPAAASKKAEGGNPPIVAASPAFSA